VRFRFQIEYQASAHRLATLRRGRRVENRRELMPQSTAQFEEDGVAGYKPFREDMPATTPPGVPVVMMADGWSVV